MSVEAADSIPPGGAGHRRCVGSLGDRTAVGIAKTQLLVVGKPGLSRSDAYQNNRRKTDLDVNRWAVCLQCSTPRSASI